MITKYKLFEKLNSRGSKSLTEEEFNQILKTSCKNWTKSKTSLYRGQVDLGPYVYTDPKGTYRTSIEDVNTHVELIDNLPSWEGYPKYSEAIIGSTINIVSGYGKVYEIVPFDNIDIAICPKRNIWDSFGHTKFGEWGEDIYKVHHFLEYVGINADVWSQISNGTIESMLCSMDSIEIFNKDDGGYVYQFLVETSEYLKKDIDSLTGKDCYNFINDSMFNPTVRGFSLVKYTAGFEAPSDRQMWTNGPVLLIYSELA